jgi:hypothetical protein
MKHAAFKVHPAKGGWLRTTLAPINDRHDASIGVVQVLMFLSLVLAVGAIARVLIAH